METGNPIRETGTGNDQFLTILDWNSKSMASLEISPSFDIRCKKDRSTFDIDIRM